jgi:hypothetical protein
MNDLSTDENLAISYQKKLIKLFESLEKTYKLAA